MHFKQKKSNYKHVRRDLKNSCQLLCLKRILFCLLLGCISLEKFRRPTQLMVQIPTLSYKRKRSMNFWKTGSFAHSKLPVILFSTTAVHNFIPKNTFSRMLAALCDTSQIHLYGSTCSQHNHPSPLCTFGADPSDCRKSI